MKAFAQKSLLTAAVVLAVSGIAYAAPVDITKDLVSNPNTASGSTGVTVTASVDPILSMDISANTLALGALNSTTYTGASLGIEVATNSKNGLTVTLDSATGGLASSSAGHTVFSGSADVGGTEGYQVLSTQGTWDGIPGQTVNVISATDITPSAKSHVIYHTNKPERASGTNDDVTLTIQARSDTATPAANDYQDVVTLTVSTTF